MVKERWPEILQAVRKARPAIGALLAEGEPIDVDAKQITLAFSPAHKFHREQLGQPAQKKFVEDLLSQTLGRPLTLVVIARSDGEGEAPADRPAAPRPDEDPSVRKVMQLFNGRIVNIEKKE